MTTLTVVLKDGTEREGAYELPELIYALMALRREVDAGNIKNWEIK